MAKANETKPETEPGGRLSTLARRAGAALVVERAWPPIVAAVCVAILFLCVSWGGAWLFAPRAFRIAGVVLFALGFLLALSPLLRLRWPAARDIAARLDRDSGATHRPATSLTDTLANDADPMARALWTAHQARLARAIEAVRVAPPAPRLAARDPYALRFGVAMMSFAAAVVAGPELYGRLAAAFDWRGGDAALAAAGSRVDAWVDPPPYAQRPPVVIDVGSGAPQTLTAFEDSVLVVRGEPGVVETKVEGAVEPVKDTAKPEKQPLERRWTIRGNGRATISHAGGKAADVAFSVIPAGTPTITLTGEPVMNLSGSMTLAYKIEDRYGVTGARADFALTHDPSKPAPRSLAEPPQAGLETPSSANGAGEARSTLDLSEHPWAGARVTMTLGVASVSGKTGRSAPVEVTLPQRPFHNPLARALVEERRELILDPDQAPKRVDAALEGLAVAPELFGTPSGVYLGLKQAKGALDDAHTDADLLGVAQLLWTMALQIEDGDMTQAQRDLRAAEQALRDALKRGASDDEIRKLTENLREAAQKFAAELAMKAEKNGDQSPQESNRQVQSLDKMMDRLEDAARNGAREEAEAMLDQMQNMFENMQSAEDGQQSAAERALQKQIDELGKLMRDQQALRDDTFRSDQRDAERQRKQGRGTPQTGEQSAPDAGQPEGGQDQQSDKDGSPDSRALGDRQKELSDRLAEMQRMLKGLGMKGEKGFDSAEGDMKEAEGDLKGEQGQSGDTPGRGRQGRSNKGAAVDAQGRALEALREGAQGLQQQMNGQGRGGQGRYQARRMRPGEQQGDDPLGRGREQGNLGQEDGALREMGSVAERARRVMDELRRRLADPNRPVDERNYLERLMKRD